MPAAFSNPFKRKHYTGAIDRVPISEQKKSLKGGEGLDYAIMNFVQQNLHTAFTDVFFPIVTMLGNHGLVWLCLIAALLLTKKYRRCGGMLLLTLAATFLLGAIHFEAHPSRVPVPLWTTPTSFCYSLRQAAIPAHPTILLPPLLWQPCCVFTTKRLELRLLYWLF